MTNRTPQELEAELVELRERVANLEALLARQTQQQQGLHNTAVPPSSQEDSPDIVLVISAAVAAFLGKRASIRQIHLTGETPWAMQGRATVQASHGIEFVRGSR
ncbi:MAG: hypothetical protein WBR26_01110 [Candidatus Acidiferrum sp.]